jgi:hypothetical protein
MNKGLERTAEFHSLQGHGHAWIAIENFSEDLFQMLALNDNGVDLKRFATIVALDMADNESILSRLRVLTCAGKIIGFLFGPRSATIVIAFGLVEVVNLADRPWGSILDSLGRIICIVFRIFLAGGNGVVVDDLHYLRLTVVGRDVPRTTSVTHSGSLR